MSRELDRRDFTVNQVTPAREAELRSRAAAVSNRLPGTHRIRIESFDAVTGNPLVVTSEAAPALASLLGQSVQGQWSLRVTDRAGQDVGKLNKWSIEFTV